ALPSTFVSSVVANGCTNTLQPLAALPSRVPRLTGGLVNEKPSTRKSATAGLGRWLALNTATWPSAGGGTATPASAGGPLVPGQPARNGRYSAPLSTVITQVPGGKPGPVWMSTSGLAPSVV